jgi:hypothetical protein
MNKKTQPSVWQKVVFSIIVVIKSPLYVLLISEIVEVDVPFSTPRSYNILFTALVIGPGPHM